MKKQNSITINEKEILIIYNEGEYFVAVKPICEALGIDYPTQFQKIKNDPFLNSVVGLSPTTGADNKDYKMVVLPYKFIFGWLFTINPEKVKPEMKDIILQYRNECYITLYDHFTNRNKIIARKAEMINEMKKIQNRLGVNEDYQKLMELQGEISRMNREAQSYDKNELDIRLSLFDEVQ